MPPSHAATVPSSGMREYTALHDSLHFKFSPGFASVLLILILSLTGCWYLITHNEMSWDKVDQKELGTSHLLQNPFYFFLFRLSCGLIIWSTCLFLYFDRVGLKINVLTRGVVHALHLKHASRFSVFTVWCWSLQGIYFFLACLCTASVPAHLGNGGSDGLLFVLPKPLLNLTHVLFEVSFAVAYLVTFVVTFVLIPGTRSRNMPTDNFFSFLPLLFHNANVFFMLCEVLLNNTTIVASHFPFVVIYGSCYVVFSWIWFHYNGVFYYFFMDYDAPFAWLWFICLLLAVSCFYFLGWGISMASRTGNTAAIVAILIFSLSILCIHDSKKKKTE